MARFFLHRFFLQTDARPKLFPDCICFRWFWPRPLFLIL